MLGAALHQLTAGSSAPGAPRRTGAQAHRGVPVPPREGKAPRRCRTRTRTRACVKHPAQPGGSVRLCPLPSLGPHRVGLCSPRRAARDLPASPGSAGAGAAVPGPRVAAAPTSAPTPPHARSRLCHACRSVLLAAPRDGQCHQGQHRPSSRSQAPAAGCHSRATSPCDAAPLRAQSCPGGPCSSQQDHRSPSRSQLSS